MIDHQHPPYTVGPPYLLTNSAKPSVHPTPGRLILLNLPYRPVVHRWYRPEPAPIDQRQAHLRTSKACALTELNLLYDVVQCCLPATY